MTRISKKAIRRATCPRKHRKPAVKTGPKKDNLPAGFKTHENAADNELAKKVFIPKIK